MQEFTTEQWYEFYGIIDGQDDDFEDDDFDNEEDENKPRWKPDFTKWVAIYNDMEEDDDDEPSYCIAPKPFWEANSFVPDHCIGFDIPGFRESQEHVIKPISRKWDRQRQREELIKLGFDIIDDPDW